MRRFFLRSLGVMILAAALCASGQAHAEKRVALVIGNSAYRNVPSLPNPANDADQVAALLKSAGFSAVELRHDLGIAELRRAISDFAEAASDVDVAVIYFAGHGIEIDGANYIIPVDARLLRDFDIEDETVSVDRILKSIEPEKASAGDSRCLPRQSVPEDDEAIDRLAIGRPGGSPRSSRRCPIR
jgi:hypothetical protein